MNQQKQLGKEIYIQYPSGSLEDFGCFFQKKLKYYNMVPKTERVCRNLLAAQNHTLNKVNNRKQMVIINLSDLGLRRMSTRRRGEACGKNECKGLSIVRD